MSLHEELLRRFPALKSLPAHSVAVGGAIRDLILGREPADVDVECDDPEKCAAAIGRVIELGRGDLKVYRAVAGKTIYDFSARTELRRRDFTMNAIALDLTTGALDDPFEGEADIRRGVIRMIEAKNFQDDPLRMLRGVRLALQFGFAVEEKTIATIRRRAPHITTVAAERVTYELETAFSFGKFRPALRLLNQCALDEPLFGYALEADRFASDEVSCAASFALIVRDPQQFAERWKWSRELLHDVLTLQRLLREPSLIAVFEAGERVGGQLPALFRAVGRAVPPMPDFNLKSLLDGDEIAKIADVMGAEIGARKRALIEAQLLGKVKTRDDAERFVK